MSLHILLSGASCDIGAAMSDTLGGGNRLFTVHGRDADTSIAGCIDALRVLALGGRIDIPTSTAGIVEDTLPSITDAVLDANGASHVR